MKDNIGIESYPLSEKCKEACKTASGVSMDAITFENIACGEIRGADCRVGKESLLLQAEIAEDSGNPYLAQNLRRAAEMTAIGNERLIEIYNALRPYRSSAEELEEIACELEETYAAYTTAAFIREARVVLKERKRLRGDR